MRRRHSKRTRRIAPVISIRTSGPRSKISMACRDGSCCCDPRARISDATWVSTTFWSARCGAGLRLEREADRVLPDGDHVAVGELLLDHLLTVDLRAVGAAEVADPERTGADLDAPVMARGRGIAHDDVVVRRAADRDHLVGQRDDPS